MKVNCGLELTTLEQLWLVLWPIASAFTAVWKAPPPHSPLLYVHSCDSRCIVIKGLGHQRRRIARPQARCVQLSEGFSSRCHSIDRPRFSSAVRHLGPRLLPRSECTLARKRVGWSDVVEESRAPPSGISTNTFQHFDYGSAALNALAYEGKTDPPTYEPKDILSDLPMLVVYGGQDLYSAPEGALECMSLTQTMPQSVSLPHYAHFDLSLSLHRVDDVYGRSQPFFKTNTDLKILTIHNVTNLKIGR